MVTKLATKFKALRKRVGGDERANGILVVSLLMIPVMCALFGYGVDFTLGNMARNTIQRDLDLSTQSALSQLTNPGTNGNTGAYPLYVNSSDPDCGYATNGGTFLECKTMVLYKLQRANIPLKSCFTDRIGSTAAGLKRYNVDGACGFYEVGAPSLTHTGTGYKTTYTFTISVREQIHYTFLQILGIPVQNIDVTSSASTSGGYPVSN